MNQQNVSRTYSANQVYADLQENHQRGGHARLVVDQSHPFFFDHPLDHVPGLLLIEAMNQLAERQAYRAQDDERSGLLYTKSAEVAFTKFCVFGIDAWVIAQAHDVSGRRIDARVEQGGTLRCKGVFEFAPLPVKAWREAGEQPPLEPCAKALLNKCNEANVMIQTPVKQGSIMTAHLLPPHPANVLVDDRFGLLPALYLLEAYMQTQRYLNKVFLQQNDGVRMRDTLCGVSIRLFRPVRRGEPVRVERDIAEKRAPMTGLHLHQGTLHVAGECVGECDIKTLTVI